MCRNPVPLKLKHLDCYHFIDHNFLRICTFQNFKIVKNKNNFYMITTSNCNVGFSDWDFHKTRE